MSNTDSTTAPPETTDPLDDATDPDVLLAELERLREENDRLRRSYRRARRATYRRTAFGFVGVGLLALLGGVLFPDARTVLFALAGTGLFGGVLTYYLTPERFIAASVGRDVYRAFDDAGSRLVGELGLSDHRLYLPDDGPSIARLYVPQRDAFEWPAPEALDALFVVGEDERTRGIAVRPTGAGLFDEFTESLTGGLADDPDPLATQLADGVVEQFELARSVRPDVGTAAADDSEGGRPVITFGIADSAYGPVDRFDHPIASFLAVGVAAAMDAPVALDVTDADDARSDYLVTCSIVADDD
ncbi:MAG: hypothetical protein ACI91T_003094 [Natronomonas sp.]|jgi:hypothetical protein